MTAEIIRMAICAIAGFTAGIFFSTLYLWRNNNGK